MPKLDLDTIPQTDASRYPPEYRSDGRWVRRLGPTSGLVDFGASYVTLKPGAWSSQRHWHEGEDEFIVMLSGEAVLVDDSGETVMRAGDCATFPKGDGNGHHLQNRTGPIACSSRSAASSRQTATIPTSICTCSRTRASGARTGAPSESSLRRPKAHGNPAVREAGWIASLCSQ